MTRLYWIAACSFTAMVPAVAAAETQQSPFGPATVFRPTEFPFESGFIPADGPLRINLGAVAFQDVTLAMEGAAEYDFDASSLVYRGREDGGLFRSTLGAEITATISINALGLETDFEVGIWDISESAERTFVPYVLPGNPARPLTLAEEIGPYNLVDQPFDILGVPGTIHIDFLFEVPGVTFVGTQIDLDDAAGPAAVIVSHDAEGQPEQVALPGAQPGESASAWATMNGEFSSELTLHLYPTVTVQVFGVEFDIGPFDVAVAYPVITDQPVVFEDIELQYDVPATPTPEPEPEPSDDDGGADETSGGEDDGGDDDGGLEDSGGDDSGGVVEPDSAGGGGRQGEDVGGCGCTSDQGSGAAGLLVLVGATAIRRRRRT